MTHIVDRVYVSPNIVAGVNINTYYFDADGNMYTGWITTIDNKTYFFDNLNTLSKGSMMIGWVEIMNEWYYFGLDGTMFVNGLTPDGYFVGADGKWVNKTM